MTSYPNATTPMVELNRRVSRLQTKMAANDIDGALIVQNSDLFYFAGTAQQAHLYIPVDGLPILMVRKDMTRARTESPLERIVPLSSPRRIPEILKAYAYPQPASLGLECDVLPVNRYQAYQKTFSGCRILDASTLIRMTRAVKSAYEIDLITQAAERADQVAGSMGECLEPGLTEIELAGMVEARARALGHQGFVRMRLWGSEMFYGHLMSGPAAAVPSYLASPTGGTGTSPAFAQGPGFRKIGRNETVLLDYVFAWQGYLADHTRIFAIGGLPDELKQAHEAMLGIQEMLKTAARPGIPAGELYELALARAADRGLGEFFMGTGDQRVRFVGHGIGIELDEFPFLAKGQEMALV